MRNRRVVVTGMGVLTPIGNTLEEFSANLRNGVSGKEAESVSDVFGCRFPPVFRVKAFNPHQYGTHILDPFIQYAVAAAESAVQDARFDMSAVDPYAVGLSISSSKGGVYTLDSFRDRFLKHPSAILGARIYSSAMPNSGNQWIARRMKIKGPAKCYVAACATGVAAVTAGFRMVQEGHADYCLAGASDASIVPILLAGYNNMKALAKRDIRPFDKRRDGFLVGEGAAVLFLETLESAKALGIRIYGEVLDAACAQDSKHAILFDHGDHALSRALKTLLARSGISCAEIDYVHLHGTGTKPGDVYETAELKEAFGEAAYGMAMSSTKAATGHMLGATGAVEIAAMLVAMRDGFVPPTLNLEEKDEACDLDYTPLRARKKKIAMALKVSMGFGGQAMALLLRKV
ncbi:MAG TPA: beta-ketoacyl-[acyl-carrier-protein] synthase family protein [Candidatus Omnitrophota bacterium]|nr:beta-ketoacyl-[acyl-carrier-protein] synthase family protein [Candidatus Omnitrophota bacterium]